MIRHIVMFAAAIFSSMLIFNACKPTVNSSPGHACFTIFKAGPNNLRTNDITAVKVGEDIAVDLSCAGVCSHSIDVDWGDGSRGEYLTHKYGKPGTYSVKFECSTKGQKASRYAKKRRHYTKTSRYQSSRTITVTQ
ncbi:MAG: hypothetical protein KA369_15540 [Spirochaetes bacterium]|nr:hypothetical protein [Spirochaetota bacterium]